ncbi:MAG TPA: thioredoxin family protein [Polyangia bacterium]
MIIANTRRSVMKTLATAFAAAAFATTGLVATAHAEGPLALGAAVPEATTKLKSVTTEGELTLAKAAGPKGTLVVFTCNGCPYAKAWEDRIVELANGYAKKGVGVVIINSNNPTVSKGDTEELTRARAKEKGIKVPYAVDPESKLAKAFGATKTPETFLFDKGGALVYHGAVDDNHEEPAKVAKRYLKDALDAVIADKKPAVAETKSIGCTIKFAKVS